VYLLTGSGFTEQAARQAISRASNAGWIESEKRGRAVRWSVTPETVRDIDAIRRRVLDLNHPPAHWDGNCLIVNVTVPAEKESLRRRLYSALGWAGFGNPAPGLWASPHVERLDELRQIVERLDIRDSVMTFTGQTVEVGLTDEEIVRRAWNLDEVAARYEALLARFAGRRPEPGDDLLFSHLRLVDEWRQFPTMDPQLPQDLLPDWIGRRATETFTGLYREWRPRAHERWREIVAITAPPERNDLPSE
jgi:phenylacetic acid degradation operon negative regulatory protein